ALRIYSKRNNVRVYNIEYIKVLNELYLMFPIAYEGVSTKDVDIMEVNNL
ncbi:uncharacterized protein B0T23DRAFT_324831, partial [Neurospora hispaniola]